jgi:hypothetical protein
VSQSESLSFLSRQRKGFSRLKYFVVSLSNYKQIRNARLKTDQGRFISCLLPLRVGTGFLSFTSRRFTTKVKIHKHQRNKNSRIMTISDDGVLQCAVVRKMFVIQTTERVQNNNLT